MKIQDSVHYSADDDEKLLLSGDLASLESAERTLDSVKVCRPVFEIIEQ